MKTETHILILVMILMASITLGISGFSVFYPNISYDEAVWKNVSTNWLSPETQAHDNKSPVFLAVNHLLYIEKTVLFTRILNYIIIGICTFLIWSMTKRWESLLLPIIFFYSDQMVLLDTSFEVLFIILALKYDQLSGMFTGLAMIFRPYAILYTILLKREQQLVVLVIGAVYASVLLAYGSFFPYLYNVTGYAIHHVSGNYYAFVFLLFFAFLGYRNRELFRYGVVGSLPLTIRLWGHYFIPGMVLFFLSYLSIKRDD